MWVLSREINEYNQDGEYFVTVFTYHPTVKQVQDVLKCDEKLANHICEEGGRIDTEYEWYHLRKVQSGETIDQENKI